MNVWKFVVGVLLVVFYGCFVEYVESVFGNVGFQGEMGKFGIVFVYEYCVGICFFVVCIDV